jgi:hypothetical protein
MSEWDDAFAGAGVGVIRGLDFDKYLAIPAANSSRLKLLDHSPARYRINPVQSASRSMGVGTLIHCAVLEPSQLDARYVAPPASCADRRTKAHKEWLTLAPRNAEVVKAEDLNLARAVAATLHADPHLDKFFGPDCESELTILWTDESGIRCKARVDKYCPGIGILDLKSTQNCSVAEFPWSAKKYGYFAQAAFYRRGVMAAIKAGLLPPAGDDVPCYVLAVETGAVRDHALYQIPAGEIYAFDAEIARKLDLLATCERTGSWPGPNGAAWAPIPLEYRGKIEGMEESTEEIGADWGTT